jgi:hypothetical protein
MLRIKRSVEGSFSTVNFNAAEMSGSENQVKNLTTDQAMKMIAERKGVELEPQARPIEGFVSASKRSAAAAQLDDVEERVAKLRKAIATETAKTPESADDDDDNEIDIEDDIDELLGQGGEEEAAEESAPANTSPPANGMSTMAVPAAVFRGLTRVAESGKGEEVPVGARERLKAAKGSNGQ